MNKKTLNNTYLDFLQEEVSYGREPRPRVRNINKWKNHSQSTCKSSFIDLHQHNGDIWVWSDLHFNHRNIIRYGERPFDTIPDMNEQLIENHNSIVKPDDIVIWGGDIGFSRAEITNEYLNRCNGYKILVIGNHDFNKRKLFDLDFDEIHLTYTHDFIDGSLWFTHYPVEIDMRDKGIINVHGHVHQKTTGFDYHINISCENLDYTPINLNQVINIARTRLISND